MNNKLWDAIWVNGSIATMTKSGLYVGAIAVRGDKIAWVGSMADLKDGPEKLARNVFDVEGRCITPGFIDCHTHLVYAGNRCQEFVMRLQGRSYTDMAKAGGGIRSTVLATRHALEDALLEQSLVRARALMASGVTTIEIKSGYGLDLKTELKMLRVAKRIGEILPVTVVKTFLGAHAVPEEYKGRADEYINMLCDEVIPIVAKEKLAEAVDVFCETIAFNLSQTERIFMAAKQYGLRVKCHAEQLSDSGSAGLAAKYHALSVDHLEHLSKSGVKAMAESGTVAVLLPGAFYFLKEKKSPPIALLREYKIPMAIASDCNPGTSPVTSILLMLNMGCTLFELTPEEVLMGVTCHAARALGLEESIGTLEMGKMADFIVWDVGHPYELAYHLGLVPLYQRVKAGKT